MSPVFFPFLGIRRSSPLDNTTSKVIAIPLLLVSILGQSGRFWDNLKQFTRDKVNQKPTFQICLPREFERHCEFSLDINS